MKYFFRNYWIQVIAVFVSLFIGSRVIAMVFADIEGTGRLSTVADTSSEVSSELSSESSEVSSEESSDNPLDELFESTDWRRQSGILSYFDRQFGKHRQYR